MSALVADQVIVRRGRRDVVHGVDLAVETGEIVAMLGPNGAGKSTLLAALGGVVAVRSGRIHRRGRVASVLQTPALAQRSARANVELALAWSGVPRAQRRSRAEQALTLMRASHLSRRAAPSLSGGEQRRVHLARAVAVAPDVLLLDEPFDGLDPNSHAELRADTVDALRTSASAVVVVLHERADAWAMADRIVVMFDGRVHADGAPQHVLDNPPTPEVARFLGYDGEFATDNGILLTRATHVHVDAKGTVSARVERVVVIEDGFRALVRTDRGTAWTVSRNALRTGDDVRLTITGGAKF